MKMGVVQNKVLWKEYKEYSEVFRMKRYIWGSWMRKKNEEYLRK